jgi:hypothetical protein
MFYSKSKSQSSKNQYYKNQSSKKTSKILRSKFWGAAIILFLLILASSSAYIYFFKNSDVIEIFPDDSIIKIKAKINANLEGIIKKDSIIYDIIMKKRELEGKTTKLSESIEDPIDILLNKSSNKDYFSFESDESVESNDIFSKYSCVEPSFNQNPNQNLEPQQQPKEYNFKITENNTENNAILAKLKNRQKQKYFYCDLNYFYDKNQAEKEYTKIRYIYAKIISLYPHTIHSKQKNDKYVYVLSIGRFNKFEEARSLCRRLVIQKQNCMVTQW